MVTGSARGTTFRRRGMAPALAIVMVFVSACGSAESGSQGEYSDEHGSVSLAHVHGLGVNPADSTLYVASHHGLFRVTGDAAPEQVAGRTQDFMGFTVVGPDHFLGSGHPGPGDADQPSHLGLIESRDAGLTWTPVSLSGEADFHAMEAEHDRVYGYDSVSGQIMVSTDRKTWDRRARLGLADIAVSPVKADTLLATTREGLARSGDGGRAFGPVPNAPAFVVLDWPSADRLLGVGPDGRVQVSDDGGTTWSQRGRVPGAPQAITSHGESDVYVATEEGIHRSVDGGRTFTVLHEL